MDITNLTKEGLIKELQELQQELDSLKAKNNLDINSHKLLEDALRESLVHLKSSMESLKDIIVLTINRDYEYIYFNTVHKNVMLNAYGTNIQLGMNLLECMTNDDDIKKAKINYDRALNGESHTTIQEYGELDRYFYETRYNPIIDENNEVIGASAYSSNITERIKAVENLKESEMKYRSLIECSSDAIFCVDEMGKYKFTNNLFASTFGKTPDYFIGKTFWDIYPKEHADQRYEVTKRVFQTGESESLEVEVPLPDKNLYYFATANPIKDETGKVVLNLTHAADITALKLAHEKIREKDLQFRKLSSNVPDLIYQFTRRPDGTYFVPVASEGIINIFGCKPEDVLEDFTPISNVLYPEDADRVISDIEYSAKHLTYFTCEFRVQIPGRETQWIYSNSTPEKLPDGSITWYGFNTNITERKKAEQALQYSRERLEEAQIIARIGNWEANLITGELYWSRVIFDIFGLDSKTFKPSVSAFYDAVYPEDREKVLESETRSEQTGLHNVVHRIIRPNGEVRYIHELARRYSDENGNLIMLRGTVQDVTELKQAEEEIIKAKNRAEESDRLKSAFLANMSHEIRTPMNGILGFADLLKEPELTDEKQKEYVKIIEKSGARMLGIINDIVDISRIEAGLMDICIKDSNVNEQIDYLYIFFKPEVEGKGLKLSIRNSLPDKESIIKTDREKLYAILTNLIKNAIKFTHKGSIEFGYMKKDKNLEFFIADTGKGIRPDNKQIIFDRFRQGGDITSHYNEGSGLGLSISKAYVEMLGGKIWVESESGKGSTFYFTIPYITEHKGNSSITKDISGDSGMNPVWSLKILIAEDDENSDFLISKVLSRFSNVLLHAKTGIEAIEICRNNPDLDLILMDIRMPEMSGYDATRLIRQFNNDVIIIAQTAYGLSGEREKAIESGCNDFITKPINKAELLGTIEKYFH